jgi:hypothetical protein
MQSLVRQISWTKRSRRYLSGDVGNKQHPVLTSLAKAAGIKASNLRNPENPLINSTPICDKRRVDTILSHAGMNYDTNSTSREDTF